MFYIKESDYETSHAAVLPNSDIAFININIITGDQSIVIEVVDDDDPLYLIENFSSSSQQVFAKAFNEYCEWEQAARNIIIESTGITLTVN